MITKSEIKTEIPLKIFLSYSSYDHDLAEKLDIELRSRSADIVVSRFTRDVRYRDSFKRFMQGIGQHDYVVSIVSDNYLKSYACMFEAGEIVDDVNFQKKFIFIVVSENDKIYYTSNSTENIAARIYDPVDRIRYIQHWEREHNMLLAALEQIESPAAKIELTEGIRRMRRIIDNDLGVFLNYVADARGFSFGEMVERKFSPIFDIVLREEPQLLHQNKALNDTDYKPVSLEARDKQALMQKNYTVIRAEQARDDILDKIGNLDLLKYIQHYLGVKVSTVSDKQMNKYHAQTFFFDNGRSGREQVVMLSESLRNSILEGNFEARHILAHELGHLLLHTGDSLLPNVEDTEREADLFASILLRDSYSHNRIPDKYIEQAKKTILDRFKRNRAEPNHMIMTQELLSMKFECQNPKVADAMLDAIDELTKDDYIYHSGLGVHLTQKGYDAIY